MLKVKHGLVWLRIDWTMFSSALNARGIILLLTRDTNHPMKATHASMPGDHVAVDITDPYTKSNSGDTFLMVLVDVCIIHVFLILSP